MVPDTGGGRDYTPLSYQLAEQVRRPLPPEVRVADPTPDMGTIASPFEPEMISNDDESRR